MFRKIGLYFLSLWLLFFLIMIITVDIPLYFGKDWEFIGSCFLLKQNVIPVICLFSLIIGVLAYWDFKHKVKGTSELSFEITEIENNDYELLAFLATYIIPLVCFNFGSIRHALVLLILLIVIGVIYIRTDLFYANPILAILKFRIYKVSGYRGKKEHSNKILITKDTLRKGDHVKYVKLDNKIYYAYKIESK